MSGYSRKVLVFLLILILVFSSVITPVFATPVTMSPSLVPYIATTLVLAGESFNGSVDVMNAKCEAFFNGCNESVRNYFAVQMATNYLNGKKYIAVDSNVSAAIAAYQNATPTGTPSDSIYAMSPAQRAGCLAIYNRLGSGVGYNIWSVSYNSGYGTENIIIAKNGYMDYEFYFDGVWQMVRVVGASTASPNVTYYSLSNGTYVYQDASATSTGVRLYKPYSGRFTISIQKIASVPAGASTVVGGSTYDPSQVEGRKWEVPGVATLPSAVPGDLVSEDGTVLENPPITGDYAQDYTGLFAGVIGLLQNIYNGIIGLPAAIVGAISANLAIDVPAALASSGLTVAFNAKFGALTAFSSLFALTPLNNEHSGKFYMDMPLFMGGQRLCVLDITWGKPVLDWGKLFIRSYIWIRFAMFVIAQFRVRFQMG